MNSQNLSLVARITEQPVPTLEEWADTWLEIFKVPTVSLKTADGYRQTVARILKAPFRQQPIDTITAFDLQRQLNRMQKEQYSRNTIEKARNAMRQMFSAAVIGKLIDTDPSKCLVVPKAPTKVVKPLTDTELKKVIAACQADRSGHLLLFLLYTGLRRAEFMALRWEDLHEDEGKYGTIYIRKSKTAAGIRCVPLVYEAAEIIRRQQHTDDGFIFHSTADTPLTEIVLRRLCKRIAKAAGIAHLHPHMCRHTFVTQLCKQGVPAKAIAQIIGHAKATYVLDIYALLEKEALCEAIYALDDRGHTGSTVTVTLRLDKETVSALEDKANKLGVSLEQYICCQIK